MTYSVALRCWNRPYGARGGSCEGAHVVDRSLLSEAFFRQSQLHNTMKNDVSTDPLQANQGSSSSTSAVDLEPEPSLAVYGSTGNGSGIAVLKYSKGNGLQRTRALLTGYLEEAAALTDTNAPDLVAEFKRLRALKQSYDKVAYGTSQNKLLAMRTESPEAKEATEGKADGDREMSSPQKVEMVDLRAPIPSSELPSPSPVHPPGTERVPDDEVEDDDETLESRSGASEGTTAAPVSDNNTAMDARGTVMRKFVEYEGAKRRGVLSKIRDMRRLGSGCGFWTLDARIR